MVSVTPFDDYYDLVEAARELSIHPQSLRRLIKQNKIPATMFAGDVQEQLRPAPGPEAYPPAALTGLFPACERAPGRAAGARSV